jgi:flagellar biogenesis protein FliO
MNRRNFPIAVSACACSLVLAANVHGQIKDSQSPPVSKTDSPLGLTVSFFGSESPAQTHGPEIASEVVQPSLFFGPVEEAEFPVVDPESIPLPLTGSSGSVSPAGNTNKTGGTAWWNGPEAKVVGFLVLLIFGAWIVGRISQRGGRPSRITGGSRPSGVVQVLARFPIGRGTQLILLECGQRILLLEQQKGKTSTGLQTLSEFSSREDVAELRSRLEASNRSEDESFQKDLEKSLGMYSRSGATVKFVGSPMSEADSMETVDLTRRRPRRAARGPE